MKNYAYFLVFIILFSINPFNLISQVHEGDTIHFWSVSYIDWPPLWGVPQRDIISVCKKKGQHCNIMVETTAIQPSQSSIDLMAMLFDQEYYPRLTAKYGPVPDVFDNDSGVYILAITENNWSGYFDPAQQMTDSMVFSRWGMHSSQHEIIYIAAETFEQSAPGIISHEFGHLLHWGRDHSPEPPANPVTFWEDAFVDEGFSTFAAIYLTENIFQRNIWDYSAFFSSNPDIPLIWFTNYNQVKLFMLFMFEHYGQWDYVTALINEQLNGIPGIENSLHSLGYQEHFDDIFQQWSIANLIDDSLYDGGKYEYAHYRFPPCHIDSDHYTFPVASVSGSLSAYAADYISFQSVTPKNISINFQGEHGRQFRLSFVQQDINTGRTLRVINIPLDTSNHAVYRADSIGSSYTNLIMIPMCLDSTVHYGDSATYTYSASNSTEIYELNTPRQLAVFPNPASDQLLIQIPEDINSKGNYTIYNFTGQYVMSGYMNSQRINLNISKLKSGLYYINYTGVKTRFGGKFIKK